MKYNRPINLQAEVIKHIGKKRMRKYKLPKIGVYYPTTLVQGCVRSQWNFYKLSIHSRRFPDGFILKTTEGNAWHDIIEQAPVWDEVEKSVSMRIPFEQGGYITIRGRADAIRGDTIYDFKRTERVPWGYKPKFPHIMQLNFYMECLGKPKGVIAYIGYDGANFRIKEYYHVLSDWHTEQLINRALTLHTYLINDVPPVCTCRSKIHEIEWENYLAENKDVSI
jgi:hypothetical protein